MLGERLKELRKKKNITQERLAEIIGIERSSIGKYEGKQNIIPSVEVLNAIADFFDISTDYLLGRTNSPNPEPAVQLIEGLKYAFFDDYQELDDEDRAELNRMAERMLELKRLKAVKREV